MAYRYERGGRGKWVRGSEYEQDKHEECFEMFDCCSIRFGLPALAPFKPLFSVECVNLHKGASLTNTTCRHAIATKISDSPKSSFVSFSCIWIQNILTDPNTYYIFESIEK